jgi:hypothetical protein
MLAYGEGRSLGHHAAHSWPLAVGREETRSIAWQEAEKKILKMQKRSH